MSSKRHCLLLDRLQHVESRIPPCWLVLLEAVLSSISRGGKNAKTFNTSNLVQHLKSKHQDDYKEFEKHKALKADQADQANEPCKVMKRQLSLEESGELVRLWDISDSSAQRVHRRIGEMIAIDCQPFSVVEDVGFTRLLTHAVGTEVLPSESEIHNRSDTSANPSRCHR